MENPLKMCPAGSRQGLLRPVGSRDNFFRKSSPLFSLRRRSPHFALGFELKQTRWEERMSHKFKNSFRKPPCRS
jgi:hypothetical protein